MAAGDISKAMVAAVRGRIGEPAQHIWTDDEIYGYLNAAQMALAAEEGLDAAMAPLTRIRAGTWTDGAAFGLPFDFLRERYVTVGGTMARRLALLDTDALRTNVLFEPSAARPFYSVGNALNFYVGGETPSPASYELFYVRKPMVTRAVRSVSEGGAWHLLTATPHGLTTVDDAGKTLIYEDSNITGSEDYLEVTVGSIVSPTSIALSGYTSGAATGGRLVIPHKDQISAVEDPLLPALFHGMIMEFAVSRCHEQAQNFKEAARLRNHFLARVEALKQRYGTGRPYDNLQGDPARRVAQ